jgi:hypothetical protein
MECQMPKSITYLLTAFLLITAANATAQTIYFEDGTSYELAVGESVYVSGSELYGMDTSDGVVVFTQQGPVVGEYGYKVAETVVVVADDEDCSPNDFDLNPCSDPKPVPTCVFDYNPSEPGKQCLPDGVTVNADGSINLGGPTPQAELYNAYEFVQDDTATLADVTSMARFQPGNYTHAVNVLNSRLDARADGDQGVSDYERKFMTSNFMNRVVKLGDLVESLYNLGFTKSQIHSAYVEGK